MMLSLNSENHPMKPSVKISLMAAAIATIGIGGIAKMGSASSPNRLLMAVAQQKVESHTYKANKMYAYVGEELEKNAKVSLLEARKIALKAHPGKIIDEELEKESGGSGLRYSFDIKQGVKTYEIGVDAMTGKVLENAAEGKNPD
jgi:uncharacterized membrane protein YkoI